MKILSVSDVVIDFLYSPQIRERFNNIDLIFSCGDLPYYYVEYILTVLNTPLFYVRGNHANVIEYSVSGPKKEPSGAVDLHRQVIEHNGVLLAGVEGSLRYNLGPFQYTQSEMWGNVLALVPKLLINRVNYGRYLDFFISHAPPWGIHDQSDLPHQGIKAFRWFIKVFKPIYHFHGHTHVYHPGINTKTKYEDTQVVNTYGYMETNINLSSLALRAGNTNRGNSP